MGGRKVARPPWEIHSQSFTTAWILGDTCPALALPGEVSRYCAGIRGVSLQALGGHGSKASFTWVVERDSAVEEEPTVIHSHPTTVSPKASGADLYVPALFPSKTLRLCWSCVSEQPLPPAQ